VYWVVREATRKTMQNKPLEFSNKELMLEYAKKLAKKKFGVDLTEILGKSVMLNKLKTQRNLMNFM